MGGTATKRGEIAPSAVAVAGAAVALLLVLRLLVPVGWNPSVFVKVGDESPEMLAYARTLLGEMVVSGGLGHDGRFFFVQANDPFYVDPEHHAVLLDRPTYRAQRMLYPTLAGGFGLLSPVATAWGMVAVNVVSLAMGTWLVARLARRWGVTPWLGLAFTLNLGLVMELFVSGAGILAWALGVGAVLALERGKLGVATASLAAAALTREAMLVTAAGLAFVCWRRHRHIPWALIVLPLASVLGWWLYVRWRLPSDGLHQVEEIGLPLRGLGIAIGFWLDQPGIDMVVALLVLAVCLLFAVRALRSADSLAWAALGFVVLLPLLSEQVWLRYFDIARAAAPVFTAYPLLLTGRGPPGPELGEVA